MSLLRHLPDIPQKPRIRQNTPKYPKMLIFRVLGKYPKNRPFLTPLPDTPIFDPPPKYPQNALFEKYPFFLKMPFFPKTEKTVFSLSAPKTVKSHFLHFSTF